MGGEFRGVDGTLLYCGSDSIANFEFLLVFVFLEENLPATQSLMIESPSRTDVGKT